MATGAQEVRTLSAYRCAASLFFARGGRHAAGAAPPCRANPVGAQQAVMSSEVQAMAGAVAITPVTAVEGVRAGRPSAWDRIVRGDSAGTQVTRFDVSKNIHKEFRFCPLSPCIALAGGEG